ncbi:M81 family metallopeptidase [Promicromonospora soli]|uniref:Microcystin degradation protein MlrC n=1 Tax=Promicromonospora soli TaxID=2035533 RepID=A0A919KUR5_9MICO|nr:M81 family metallopeptidase [Promicromonospora soli]GHH73239.1 microcystin degradation protein MlrC [Promicromonospora soli]
MTTSRPRVAIAGMSIESSTFSPHRSGWEAFTLRRGDELVRHYPFLADGAPLRDAAAWTGVLHARSLPGGAVPAEVYESVRDEIVATLRAQQAEHGAYDGVLLDIHGAMTVVGRDDAEADLAAAVRAAIGPGTLISTTMDLHGNVPRELAEASDLITCYRMAPHEDVWETRERAAANLLSRLREGGAPKKAWLQVPVLLPGEKTSTRIEPAKSIYADVARVAELPGVVDAALWVGYAWADEPSCRAAVVVTGDSAEVIVREAEQLARQYWEARDDFEFVAPAAPYEECVAKALASAERPYFLSDSGDNPTAGGAGDVTWTLAQLLAEPAFRTLPEEGGRTAIYASLPDASAARAVADAFAAHGAGAAVDVEAGARVDDGPHGPVRLRGVVEHVSEGDPDAGIVAVVRVDGLRVILTERRKPYHLESDFTSIGLDPRGTDVVVVKIGYLEPDLYDMAADWMLMLTPGGVDQDLLRLGHHRLAAPVHPFHDFEAEPPLRAQLL